MTPDTFFAAVMLATAEFGRLPDRAIVDNDALARLLGNRREQPEQYNRNGVAWSDVRHRVPWPDRPSKSGFVYFRISGVLVRGQGAVTVDKEVAAPGPHFIWT